MKLRALLLRGLAFSLILFLCYFWFLPTNTKNTKNTKNNENVLECDYCDWADNRSASCCLTNVCFVPPLELRSCSTFQNIIIPKEIMIGSRGYRHSVLKVSNESLSFTCNEENVIPGLSILFEEHIIGHYGHALIDNVFAILQLLHHFMGFYTQPYNLVAFGQAGPLFNFTPLLTVESVFVPNMTLCFHKLLVGMDGMTITPQQQSSSPDTREVIKAASHVPSDGGDLPFKFISHKLGIVTLPLKARNTIYFIDRKSRRGIYEFDTVFTELQERFSKTRYAHKFVIKPIYFEGMTAVEQAEVVAGACMLIGISGTGMHNALFLPPKSAAIEIVPGTHYFVNREFCERSTALYCEVIPVYEYFDPNSATHFVNTSRILDFTCFNQSLVVISSSKILPAIEHAADYILHQTEKLEPYVNWPS